MVELASGFVPRIEEKFSWNSFSINADKLIFVIFVHFSFVTLNYSTMVFLYWFMDIMNCVTSFNPDPRERQTVWTCIVGFAITWSNGYLYDQVTVQRYMAVKSKTAAQR